MRPRRRATAFASDPGPALWAAVGNAGGRGPSRAWPFQARAVILGFHLPDGVGGSLSLVQLLSSPTEEEPAAFCVYEGLIAAAL